MRHAVKNVEPLVYVWLYRCVLAAPYLACLEVAEKDVMLHSMSLTAADVKTKSLSAFLGETKAYVTPETEAVNQLWQWPQWGAPKNMCFFSEQMDLCCILIIFQRHQNCTSH